ncbi:uncharacterized protein BO87DRAFT_16581 [Aspergillus neoniger CBS 115656]|uniref:Uncharacterized protein n=1 Tax=Aspergillus neoniger (strain CBS 115656) TaxID=1448310 RepID=A0A318ZJ87_ASPNB|nr:hypothetical protein BO87DRAFT_16581 [Aspergillus neoniger CBS 115656]PYH36062.1 hypothetical protein BO87DRAFT_16581 [Aspergillus neoniger CBS 115656]
MPCPGGRLHYSWQRHCRSNSLLSGTRLSGFSIVLARILFFFRGPGFKNRCQLSCVCTALMIDTWCQSRQDMSQACPRLQSQRTWI